MTRSLCCSLRHSPGWETSTNLWSRSRPIATVRWQSLRGALSAFPQLNARQWALQNPPPPRTSPSAWKANVLTVRRLSDKRPSGKRKKKKRKKTVASIRNIIVESAKIQCVSSCRCWRSSPRASPVHLLHLLRLKYCLFPCWRTECNISPTADATVCRLKAGKVIKQSWEEYKWHDILLQKKCVEFFPPPGTSD